MAELELQGPGPGELLVQIRAAGVCHSDLSVVNGARVRPVPMALGHECAGVVVESRADGVRAGDHVILTFVPRCGHCIGCKAGRPALCTEAARANGAGELLRGGRRLMWRGVPVHHHLGVSAFADHAVVDRGSVVVIPKDIPLDLAALFGCAVLTGAGAVFNTARVRPGDTVAVWGLGGVGMAAVMAAVAANAITVIAIDPDRGKRDLALEVGATAALKEAFDVTARGGMTVTVGLPDQCDTDDLAPAAGGGITRVGRLISGIGAP